MTFLQELLSGGPEYNVSQDIGGAMFSPKDDSHEALRSFQRVAEGIISNDGLGYVLVKRLIHRSSDYAESYIDRIVVNF